MFGNGVRYFLVAAETLSFSETARRLNVSQQAVSKTIARLEEKLDLSLFLRAKGALKLTEEGKSCYNLFKETSSYLQNSLDNLRAQSQLDALSLSVGYQDYIELSELMSSSIQEMKRSYSGLSITVERHSPYGLLDRLLTGQLDVALLCRRFLPENSRLKTMHLANLPLLLIVSDKFTQTDHDLNALRQAPLIIDRLEGESAAATERRARQESSFVGLAPKHIVVTPNRGSAYAAVNIGQGVLPCTSLSRFLTAPGITICETGVYDELVCCWRPGEHKRPGPEFIQCVQKEIGRIFPKYG